MSAATSARSWSLRPVSWIYGLGVIAWRGARRRPQFVRRAPVPVVSVGNLTVGGTGKGPMVRWIAQSMRRDGRRPMVALRGYRAGAGGSDEALEHRAALPEVPIAVGADRLASILAARAKDPTIDVAILDDGFQHWRLARDLDLVLVDASRPGFDEAMLPAGPRREPCASLRRADAVIVTRAQAIDPALEARIASLHGRAPIAWCRHAWRSLLVADHASVRAAPPRVESAAWLAGRRVSLLAGIGNPEALLSQARQAVPSARWLRRLPDHAEYRGRDLEAWIREAADRGDDTILVTAKDWVKIEPLLASGAASNAPSILFVVPSVAIEFLAGEGALRDRLRRLPSLD